MATAEQDKALTSATGSFAGNKGVTEMGTWLLFQGITTPELSLVEEKRGRELPGLKQSSCKDEGKATGYLLQDEILFGGSRLCHCEVTQKSLHLHQVGQLVNEDICQECTELWPWRGREER